MKRKFEVGQMVRLKSKYVEISTSDTRQVMAYGYEILPKMQFKGEKKIIEFTGVSARLENGFYYPLEILEIINAAFAVDVYFGDKYYCTITDFQAVTKKEAEVKLEEIKKIFEALPREADVKLVLTKEE